MGKVNFNRNTFLEKEELLRFQKFMLDSPVNKVFLNNTIKYGIIDTSGGVDPNDFKVEASSTPGSIKISNISRAYTSDGLIIEQSSINSHAVSTGTYWLKIKHKYDKLEVGTISINSQGVVTGSSTKFKEVIRSQSTEVPVKIKLMSSNNSLVYEVVDVIDDTNLILQGDSFVAESDIKYYVIGSTPLGETITDNQLEGLYSYDSCEIVNVLETVEGVEPAGLVDGKEFWIARVTNSSGTIVSITDKREDYYWEYYIRGVTDKLDKNKNLSDLTNTSAARSNLGDILTRDEVNNLLNLSEVGWTSMNRGEAAQESDFYIFFSRIGKSCTITGRFLTSVNSTQGSVIAFIPWSTVSGSTGTPVQLSAKIRHQTTTVDAVGSGKNRGVRFYVDGTTGGSADMRLIIEEAIDQINAHFTLTFNLI